LIQENWFVLIFVIASANLAFSVVTSGPDLAVNQKQSVVLAASNHLNTFVSEELEFSR